MAKYIRKRRYRKKGRWSANIKRISERIATETQAQGYNFSFLTLCQNPPQSDTTVSQQYTVKNIELCLYVETNQLNIIDYVEELTAYIMYVPQGMNITSDFPLQHPEYILTYKYYGGPKGEYNSTGNNNLENNKDYPIKVKSRLSRRLQTGDGIIFLLTYKVTAGVSNSLDLDLTGLIRWWTKAN